jgi:hypothetical protein
MFLSGRANRLRKSCLESDLPAQGNPRSPQDLGCNRSRQPEAVGVLRASTPIPPAPRFLVLKERNPMGAPPEKLLRYDSFQAHSDVHPRTLRAVSLGMIIVHTPACELRIADKVSVAH